MAIANTTTNLVKPTLEHEQVFPSLLENSGNAQASVKVSGNQSIWETKFKTPDADSKLNLNRLNNIINVLQAIEALNNVKITKELSNSKNKCVNKFEKIIGALPEDCQKQVVSLLENNKSTDSCCVKKDFIKEVKYCTNAYFRANVKFYSSISKSHKKALKSILSVNNVIKSQGGKFNKVSVEKQRNFFKSLLKKFAVFNSKILKCLKAVNRTASGNIGLICSRKSVVDEFFQKKNGIIVNVVRSKYQESKIQKNCSPLIREQISLLRTFGKIQINRFNTLIGFEKCNIFSNFFKFNPKSEEDLADVYFPATVAKLIKEYENKNVSDFVKAWETNAKKESFLNTADIATINGYFKYDTKGKATFGKFNSKSFKEVNLKYIVNTLAINKVGSWLVSCKGGNAKVQCKDCAKTFDLKKLCLSKAVDFYMSCTKSGNCVGAATKNKKNVAFAYFISSDKYQREFTNFDVERLRIARRELTNKSLSSALDAILSKPSQYSLDSRFAPINLLHIVNANTSDKNQYNGSIAGYVLKLQGNVSGSCSQRICIINGVKFNLVIPKSARQAGIKGSIGAKSAIKANIKINVQNKQTTNANAAVNINEKTAPAAKGTINVNIKTTGTVARVQANGNAAAKVQANAQVKPTVKVTVNTGAAAKVQANAQVKPTVKVTVNTGTAAKVQANAQVKPTVKVTVNTGAAAKVQANAQVKPTVKVTVNTGAAANVQGNATGKVSVNINAKSFLQLLSNKPERPTNRKPFVEYLESLFNDDINNTIINPDTSSIKDIEAYFSQNSHKSNKFGYAAYNYGQNWEVAYAKSVKAERSYRVRKFKTVIFPQKKRDEPTDNKNKNKKNQKAKKIKIPIASLAEKFNINNAIDTIEKQFNNISLSFESTASHIVFYNNGYEDNIKSDKTRVFIHSMSRGTSFLPTDLTYTQEKCLINNAFEYNNNKFSRNLLKKCNIDSKFDQFPISRACLANYKETAEKHNYRDLFRRFYETSSSSVSPSYCLDDKDVSKVAQCGATMSVHYLSLFVRPNAKEMMSSTFPFAEPVPPKPSPEAEKAYLAASQAASAIVSASLTANISGSVNGGASTQAKGSVNFRVSIGGDAALAAKIKADAAIAAKAKADAALAAKIKADAAIAAKAKADAAKAAKVKADAALAAKIKADAALAAKIKADAAIAAKIKAELATKAAIAAKAKADAAKAAKAKADADLAKAKASVKININAKVSGNVQLTPSQLAAHKKAEADLAAKKKAQAEAAKKHAAADLAAKTKANVAFKLNVNANFEADKKKADAKLAAQKQEAEKKLALAKLKIQNDLKIAHEKAQLKLQADKKKADEALAKASIEAKAKLAASQKAHLEALAAAKAKAQLSVNAKANVNVNIKLIQLSQTTNTSPYIENSKNPEAQKSFATTQATAEVTNKPAEPVIDGSTSKTANTDVSKDLGVVGVAPAPVKKSSSFLTMSVLMIFAIFFMF